MQEQSLSSVSFVQFCEDIHLNHLFQAVQEQQGYPFESFLNSQQRQTGKYDITLNPEEMEKGYESDEGPFKSGKNKKIKKKKPFFIQRDESTKKRRVKIYIESLENKVNELQTEYDKLKKINELNIGYIKKLNDSEQVINGFFVDRQKIFERMEKLIESESPDSIKLQMQCETLLKRQGAFGKQRIRAINYYFKQLLHLLLPNTQKYISEAAFNSTDIFSPAFRNAHTEAEKLQFIKKISPSDEIIQRLLEKQPALVELKTKFNEKVLEMYSNKCDLLLLVREMEKICESYGEKVTPLGKAKFLCYAELNRQQQGSIAPKLRTMYEQLQKCTKFSYAPESQQRRNSKLGRYNDLSPRMI